MNSFKKTACVFISAMTFFTFTGCKKHNNDSSVNETKSTTSSVTTTQPETMTQTTTAKKEPAKETHKLNYNNLTGKYDISDKAKGKRPVAIMINNIEASLPQYGIYNADVMFECPVEGGITRMMALYGDYTKVPDVCSVRSCRYYYALFASSFDAVYLHWGIDKTVALDTVNKYKIDHIDGTENSTLFKRDQNRLNNYSTEHTGYCDGSLIPSEIKNAGIRSDIKKDYNHAAFGFNDKFKKISDKKSTKLNIQFSDYYYSTFNYDSKSKTYKKLHNGNKHMDVSAKKQLAYTNVIVLETNDIEIINSNNGLISLDWQGGSGYCFSAGTVKKIKWSKESAMGKFKFTDESGKELKINTGKTYIGVTEKGTVSYS